MSIKHVVTVTGMVAALLVPAVPAAAGGKQQPPPPKQHCKQNPKQKQCQPPKRVKCNAGRGNGSEVARVGGRDCDPGRSGGRNNGGD